MAITVWDMCWLDPPFTSEADLEGTQKDRENTVAIRGRYQGGDQQMGHGGYGDTDIL